MGRPVRLLLDTHVLIWWLLDEPRLSRKARDLLTSPEAQVFVSSASALEMATKHRLGKLPGVKRLLDDFAGILATAGMSGLPMTIEHALAAGSIRAAHADPFDRILAAQSQIEQLLLVTSDAELSRLVPTTVW